MSPDWRGPWSCAECGFEITHEPNLDTECPECGCLDWFDRIELLELEFDR